MLRILFNSPSPGIHGGQATCVPSLRTALDTYVQLEDFRHGRATDDETTMRKCLRTVVNLASVESKILRRRPDVIHLNSAFDRRSILRDTPLAWLAARHRIPLLLMVHGSWSEAVRPAKNRVQVAKSILTRTVSTLCVLSRAERMEFERFIPEVRGKVCVAKNVIGEEFLKAERSETDGPLVLFASRFLKEKGPFDLLEAVSSIVKRVPRARFVFLGDGPDAAAFDATVDARKLSSFVQRLPHVNHHEMVTWYARAWVLVFPTLFPEGMPMVVAEAMATGTPIVTTRTRFSLSYMSESENCLYCESRSPNSIADQVITVLTDSAMRQRMSMANRRLALQFRGDIVAKEFLLLYEKLASASPRASTAAAVSSVV